MNSTELKQFLVQLSSEAGEYLRNHFYTFKNVVHVQNGATLTNTDVELAAILRRRITQTYPSHDIVVQGEVPGGAQSEYCWYIDPLDGSNHFLRSIPIYTVNIALQKNNETILGAVHNPQTHQLFFAQKGEGAFLNGLRIQAGTQSKLSEAFVCVELPERKGANQLSAEAFNRRLQTVAQLVAHSGQVETFRIGSFGQCLVANGAFDAFVDLSGTSQRQSQLASELIVREAGGAVVDLSAGDSTAVQFVMASSDLLPSLSEILNLKS